MPPRPRKELDSKRIQNSLRANILSLIKRNYRAVACRATWRVLNEDLELAKFQIASKRLLLNDAISSITGVRFFFSSISGICSNATSSKKGKERSDTVNEDNNIYPCVAFFIVYEPNEQCNDDTFFAALHNQDVEPAITPIRVRNGANEDMETAARQLFQTLKDHNNATVQEMVDISNVYCFQNASELCSESDDEDEDEEEFHPTRFPTVPCCFVIVNDDGYLDSLDTAIKRLQSDGLVVETTLTSDSQAIPSPLNRNDVTATVRKIARLMQLCNHALHRGGIYARPQNARMTYVKMMDVSSYLNKLLANDAINQDLMKHFQTVERILSHRAFEIVQQLQFDLNLIEVSSGFCFSICQRAFVADGVPKSQIGKLSPRAYIPYDCSQPPEPLYFREGVVNSFPNEEVRVNFLNKFYQCLLAGKMPHKTRKLVVAGPRDSGKTSWANVFHRIIPPDHIASVTNERQFSAAMITEATQLVIIDEWSASTMNSDLAKTMLQGGWLVTAVKHGQPRCLNSHSPFYITSNNVPDFGEENENVERRIKIFNTSSLPTTTTGIDRWIYDNAMHCIAWAANEINDHHNLIAEEELWYEDENSENTVIPSKDGEVLWKRDEILQIRDADLEGRSENMMRVDERTIHPGFVAELRSRRLARKRRRGRQVVTDSSSDEDLALNAPAVETDIDETQSNGVHIPSCPVADGTDQIHDASGEDKPPGESQPPCENDVELEDNCPDKSKSTSHTRNGDEVVGTFEKSDVEPQTSAMDNRPSSLTGTSDDNAEAVDRQNEYDAHMMTTYSPPDGWTLNSTEYIDKVANIIEYKFYKNLQKGHVHEFSERLRRAGLKRNEKEIQFWTKADPEIDALMLAIGKTREAFDVKAFVQRHKKILPALQELRNTLNVRVLPSRCPVNRALNPLDDDEGRQVPSQTWWTTVKNWLTK